MSIQFNDTANKHGLIQLIERNCLLGDGRISGDDLLLKETTSDINLALDSLLRIIFKSSGKWQYDDSTHPDYPIITTAVVANQRDYSFVTDEQGNVILDIYKVMIKDPVSGLYNEIDAVDQQSDEDMQSFYSEENITSTPTRYDKTGNGIFLDALPGYNLAKGIKIFINREALYFVYSDTTKKAGVDGLCQEYLALEPSYRYAMRHELKKTEQLKRDLAELIKDIKIRYRDRGRDGQDFISVEEVNSI
jgi:hypothetical protein